MFSAEAVIRDADGGLARDTSATDYEFWGNLNLSDVPVSYRPDRDYGVTLKWNASACSVACTTNVLVTTDIEMLNLTVTNHTKWDQRSNGGVVTSYYSPSSHGVFIETGGLWSLIGQPGNSADADRFSELSFGIWNLTPQACRVDSIHLSQADVRHEFEPCGLIPYFAVNHSTPWPGNDTVWIYDGKTTNPTLVDQMIVSNANQVTVPVIRGEEYITIRVMVLSNITDPANISVDLWFKKGDDPNTNINECSKGPGCGWQMVTMVNHLDNNYTYAMKHYWPGVYEFYFEANDTKNDITGHWFLHFKKPVGPFEVLYATMPLLVSVVFVAGFVNIINRNFRGRGAFA